MTNNAGPFLVTVINAQSADETMGQPINCLGLSLISVFIQGQGTTSSGVITIEEAAYSPSREAAYGGTWSPITTVNASDVTGGAQKAIHLPTASYVYIRARISTAIGGGGTVTVRMSGC